MNRGVVRDVVLVVLAVALVLALNLRWDALNHAPPRSDDNTHLYFSLYLLDLIAKSDSFASAVRWFVLNPNHYPPLVYEVTVLFHGLLGRSPQVPVASMLPFLLALGLGMYGIGWRLGGSMLGLACAFAALFSPVVLEFSRLYFLDMPVTGMLALTLCCLLMSEGFRRRGWTAAFGVSLALGVLTKWVILVFLLPFLLVTAWQALRTSLPRWWMRLVALLLMAEVVAFLAYVILMHPWSPDRIFGKGSKLDFQFGAWALWMGGVLGFLAAGRRVFRDRPAVAPLLNMLEGLTLAVGLAWPWYFFNGHQILEKVQYQVGVAVPFVETLRMNLADLSTMIYLGPLLLVMGLAVGLWRRDLRLAVVTMLACVAVGFVFLSTIPPDSRYLMPVLVFVVPLSFAWIVPLREWAVGVVALVVGVGLFQAAAFTIIPATSPQRHAAAVRRDVKYRQPVYLSARPIVPAFPDEGSYPFDDLLRALQWEAHPRETWLAVLAEPEDAAELQPRALKYYAALHGYALSTVEPFEALKSGWDVAGELKPCRQFLLIYRNQDGRSQLLKTARAQSWLEDALPTAAIFRFSPDFQVELLAPLDGRTGLQEAPGAGP